MKTALLLIFAFICMLTATTPSIANGSSSRRTDALQCVSTTKNSPNRYPINTSPQPPSYPADSLPPINQLHTSIDSFYAAQTHLQLLEFKTSKKGEWLKFLPNIGITYTPSGSPRPSISLSSGILYQAQKTGKDRRAKQQQIIEENQRAAAIAKSKLQAYLLEHHQLQQNLQLQETLFEIETDLFLIKKDEYQRQELAPSDYLQARRTYLLQQQALSQEQQKLERLEMEIKNFCKFQDQ